jgi:hypothetical protein
MTSWTRATTLANTLSDRFALEKWTQRNIVYGIGQREDLYARAASLTLADRDELERVIEQAEVAAKASSGAELGKALHSFTERIDRGEDLEIPSQWLADVVAYQARLLQSGIKILPDWVERVVIIPQLKVAGTLDRVVEVGGHRYIADLKTGQSLDYSHGEIAIQLCLYANSSHAWMGDADSVPRDRWGRYSLPEPDDKPDAYEPMIDVDQDRAIVIHLPVGQGECHAYWVDIAEGRRGVEAAHWVRNTWRKHKKLFTPLVATKGAELEPIG